MARRVKSPDQEVKVPLRSLSTVALVNRTLTLAAADGHDSMPFFGCVVCGDSRLPVRSGDQHGGGRGRHARLIAGWCGFECTAPYSPAAMYGVDS
jgi:hypothetical protein